MLQVGANPQTGRPWSASEIEALLPLMEPDAKAEVLRILAQDKALWRPLPGPQTQAYHSPADVVGYGGAAGGGKTDLACGKALTQHQKILILRREATQLRGVYDRLVDLIGHREGLNEQAGLWRLGKRQIEFGSTPHIGDESKYQGRPHDLLVFDEATNFLESQVRFLLGWLRTTTPGQKCQALMTFNPPVTAEGRWVISYFAPWLDDRHPNPAKPGELRYFATVDGVDREMLTPDPFDHNGRKVTPLSRTFIPSRIADNPYLVKTGYIATLQSLPEPLRSQMLNGDFAAGIEDDERQVIPTSWVDQAMARWQPRIADKRIMDSMGVDVARGGKDETVIARRHAEWFDQLEVIAGRDTPDGPEVVAQVLRLRRDKAPVHIDVIGVGGSPYDFLRSNGIQAVGLDSSTTNTNRTKDGTMEFYNLRAELWWRVREALDPNNPTQLALPPDQKLRADLCAPLWAYTVRGVQVESKDQIKKRIGRSPDRGDAVCYALKSTRRVSEDTKRYSPHQRSRSSWAA